MGYDIIGDVHGHAERLEALLTKLGYTRRNGAWRHQSRSVIFVGDFIDRGPRQVPTLELADAMIQSGSARAVMGNHEFNAIAWATPDPLNDGFYLRPRDGEKGEKNRRQHAAFLADVKQDSAEHQRWIKWFWELPVWIEEPAIQVIHACWSPKHIDYLRPHLKSGQRLTPEVVELASRKGTAAYNAVETLLKGVEVKLPAGYSFSDKDGHIRQDIRTRWWDPALTTYRAAYIGPGGVDIPDIRMEEFQLLPEPDRPTFIGHYWFEHSAGISVASRRVACVDYSVARNGRLVAYRFDGEQELTSDKFVTV